MVELNSGLVEGATIDCGGRDSDDIQEISEIKGQELLRHGKRKLNACSYCSSCENVFTVIFTKTFFILTILALLVVNQSNASLLREGKHHVVEAIWNELTPGEIRHIFGEEATKESHLSGVPKLDVIRPHLSIYRKGRRKRSTDNPRSDLHHNDGSYVLLDGLGKTFNLSLKANQDLVDEQNFVYLLRDGNETEIIDDIRPQKHLDCFYHGRGYQHQQRNIRHNVPDPSSRTYSDAAINVCNGVSGFIRTRTSGEEEERYIVHPIPPRLHATRFHDHPVDAQHHFLWRSRSKRSSQESDCGHAHEPSPIPSLSRIKRSTNGEYVYRPRAIPADSYWLRHRTVAPSILYASSPEANRRHYFPPSAIGGQQREIKGRRVRQNEDIQRREDDEDSPEFHWIEHQEPVGSESNYVPRRGGRNEDSGRPTLPPGLTDGEIENIFEANPSENLPFVTRVGREEDKRAKPLSTWIDFDTEESRAYPDPGKDVGSSSSSSTGLKNSFYNAKPRGRNDSLSREFDGNQQWITFGSAQNLRRGRHDEEIFGDSWKSSLDTDISWTEIREAQRWPQGRKEASADIIEMEPAHLTIETAVFIDKDLFKHMKSNFPDDTHGEVTRIVLAMINAVQLLYQDPSLGHRVDFVLKRLEVLATDPPGLLRPYDIDRFLTNFCKWQKTENPTSDADPLHWDHALILTGLDLYVVHQSGKISNQVVGLAPVAGMCTRSSSCTVNEGRHFESVYVVAHEIGHNLGMRHDGPQADNDCDPSSHIMSPTLGSGKITWSPCSKRYLDMFLDTSQSKCLLDKASAESRLDHDADGRLPGERFDSDRQCVLKYGRGSFHAVQQPLEDVCRDLHCRREHYTWTSHPALEGTFCGLDMWCRAGKCVSKTKKNINSNYDQGLTLNSVGGSETAAYSALKAMDGEWGQWSPFTDCSSACLVSDHGSSYLGSTGIRLAARRCDSPRPENGGRQCSGPDRKYKTCSASKICADSSRPKTTEYSNEVCGRAATVDTELTGRGYMTNTNDAERACSVWCETNERGGSRSRGWSFPDGTACKLISNPGSRSFCVAGKCQEFSCEASSYFNLSEEDCESLLGGEGKAESNAWFGNRLDSTSHSRVGISSTRSTSSTSVSIGSSPINHRSPKTGWTNWDTHSDCKLACLAPAKGLELVKRNCNVEDNQCSGLSMSVRLCKPSTVTTINCPRVQTPFEYATKVCGKYSEKIKGLSGIGMQLSATEEDKDRPCRIGCQDENVTYRFYMVNGEEGWFPAGTDCSRGDPSKKSYCMGGKCIDFGADDTPRYRITEKLLGTIETFISQRNKRQIIYDAQDWLPAASSLDQSSLKAIVDKFPRNPGQEATSSFFGRRQDMDDTYRGNHFRSMSDTVFDFSRPVTIQNDPHFKGYSTEFEERIHGSGGLDRMDTLKSYEISKRTGSIDPLPSKWPSGPVEGSFYEWRKIMSDCSVQCGKGVQETIVQCVSGNTVVDDHLCSGRRRPGVSGYSDCYRHCPTALSQEDNKPKNANWDWVEQLLPRLGQRHL